VPLSSSSNVLLDVLSCRELAMRHIQRMEKPMSYLSRLADYADAMFHGSTAHQVGGLCYRKSADDRLEVLLITTRETQRWTIPKGWPMKGLDLHQAAKREAWEEAGVKGNVTKKPFGYFSYIKTLADGEKVPSVVQVHLLETRTTRSHFPERARTVFLICTHF
jgi:8-oxo-dGTP pyrophosphatase MutT (NUDIX family)